MGLLSKNHVLSRRELDRYSRQMVFPKMGMKGQERLKNSSVAVLGLGGVGCSAAMYLACAGVGRIRLIDRDVVELNNLQRQILYDEKDAKDHRPKAVAAMERLWEINSDIVLETAVEDFTQKTAERLVKNVDIMIDGTDNLEARYLLNEVCVRQKKPFVHGAAVGDVGVITTIMPGKTPCFNCIFPDNSKYCVLQTCEGAGVIGQAPGLIGILEATEAMKFLAGFGELLASRLLYVNLSTMNFDMVSVKKNLECVICSKK